MSRFVLSLRRYGRSLLILVLVMVLGSAAGIYVLVYQRLNLPLVGTANITVRGAFPTVAAVEPGLGEPVNVAGVHIGQISGVQLAGGRGSLQMQINPDKLPQRVLYRDAHADLVPNTPLKDMQVDVTPGSPAAGVLPRGATIPISQTISPTDSDEVLQGLDTDTRTWLTGLITDLGTATSGRAGDLQRLMQDLGPTAAQLREIGDLLAARRHELAAIVHNLGTVTVAVRARDEQLGTVVRAGSATVHALADQDAALRASVAQLPPTLTTARRTLSDVAGLADALGPTATALVPTAQRLPTTLRDAQTVFRGAALLPLDQIPPFVHAVLPLVGQLPAVQRNLTQGIPPLISSFKVLGAVTNEMAFVPGGSNPGFLYWLAWFAHNADSFLSLSDANGSGWRLLLTLTCSDLASGSVGTVLAAAFGANLSSLGCPS